MADFKMNNNDVAPIINQAFKLATGVAVADDTIPLGGVIDNGSGTLTIGEDTINIESIREQFTKSLLSLAVDTIYTDTSYDSEVSDPFYQTEREYSAITQLVHAEVGEVVENSAWNQFANGDTLGTYEVYMPIVDSKLYGLTTSWQLPLTISNTQYMDSFKSPDAMGDFFAYLLMTAKNALAVHREDMSALNRNNFIGEKIHYANSVGATGVHVINLVQLYKDETGSSIKNAKAFMKDADAMRWASGKIKLYSDYMRKMSVLFNTEGKKRFTPKNRLVVEILSYFDKAMDTFALSTTYHDEIVALPNFESVSSWQKLGGLTFDDVSTVDVELNDGTTITKSGVVALLVDKWAIRHCIRRRRVAAKYFEPEDVTNYYYQYRDHHANDLGQNAIVFTLETIS